MNKRQGFTLVEVLVVMAILGVLATTVSLAVGRDPRGEVQREAERLRLLLELAIQESRWSGSPLAWVTTADGYRFDRLGQAAGEAAAEDDERFRPRRLGEKVVVAMVALEGQALAPGTPLPFYSGIPPLFVIVLRGEGFGFSLVGRPDGRVVLAPEEAT